MNVAFIKQKYVPFGGGEGYLNRLLTHCCAKGINPHLITSSWPREKAADVHIHTVPVNMHSRRSRVISFARGVAACVEKVNFDAVFSLDRTCSQDIWRAGEGVHQVWLNRRKLFEPAWKSMFTEISPGHRALLEAERECVKNTPHIIANSHLVKKDIQTIYSRYQPTIHVVYNGVDPTVYHMQDRTENRSFIRNKLRIPDDKAILLFVGSGFSRKGLKPALQALQMVPQAVMVVLGRDRTAAWKRRVETLGLRHRVFFEPPQKALRPYYQGADATLLPTWFDPFPNAGLESLFCGTPLITSLYAGVHELIQSGVNGEVVDPANPENLAQSINKTLAGSDDMNAQHIHQSVSRYTMDTNCTETLRIIQHCRTP